MEHLPSLKTYKLGVIAVFVLTASAICFEAFLMQRTTVRYALEHFISDYDSTQALSITRTQSLTTEVFIIADKGRSNQEYSKAARKHPATVQYVSSFNSPSSSSIRPKHLITWKSAQNGSNTDSHQGRVVKHPTQRVRYQSHGTLNREQSTAERPIKTELERRSWNITIAQGGKDTRLVVCHHLNARLGNKLFHYASILGISWRLNASLVLQTADNLNRVLKHPHENDPDLLHRCMGARSVRPKVCCAFDPRLHNLSRGLDYRVGGYIQSWKYFAGYEQEIKEALTFKDDLVAIADKTVQSFRMKYPESVLVGIHVRRGDYTLLSKQRIGYRVASEKYFIRAMRYFEEWCRKSDVQYNRDNTVPERNSVTSGNFRNNTSGNTAKTTLNTGHYYHSSSDSLAHDGKACTKRNVKFLVACASDYKQWCPKTFEAKSVEFLPLNSPEVDMLVLSKMDHVIISVGTYSWWVGYLSSGRVVYYKDFAAPETRIGNGYGNWREWMLPTWIPMS